MHFSETRFPADISYGSSGGPQYSTGIVTTASGHEQRNINWQHARAKYNVAHGVKTQEQLSELIAFFRARKGKAYAFRYKDWSDYLAQGEFIATADGVRKQYQLAKTYTSGDRKEVRIITKPVAGTLKAFVGGKKVAASCDTTTGIITFASPPPSNSVITADFEFDVPVRFDTDRLSASLDSYGVHSWNEIALIEIRI